MNGVPSYCNIESVCIISEVYSIIGYSITVCSSARRCWPVLFTLFCSGVSTEQRKKTRAKFSHLYLSSFSFLLTFLYISALVERISYRTSFGPEKKHYVSTSFPLALPCAAAS